MFVLLVVATFLTNTSAFAQFKTYNFTAFGVKFDIPNTHKIIKNQGVEFESGDNLTWLELYPFNDASVTSDQMIDAVVSEKAMSIEQRGKYTSGGYEGTWIRCTDAAHPEWKFWVIGFIDPNSETNFYAIIWYKKNNQAAYDIAYKMSYSFKK